MKLTVMQMKTRYPAERIRAMTRPQVLTRSIYIERERYREI